MLMALHQLEDKLESKHPEKHPETRLDIPGLDFHHISSTDGSSYEDRNCRNCNKFQVQAAKRRMSDDTEDRGKDYDETYGTC